jgi:hypothetical protein
MLMQEKVSVFASDGSAAGVTRKMPLRTGPDSVRWSASVPNTADDEAVHALTTTTAPKTREAELASVSPLQADTVANLLPVASVSVAYQHLSGPVVPVFRGD